LARAVLADPAGADDHTKLLGAVLVLMSDELDRLGAEVERLTWQAR